MQADERLLDTLYDASGLAFMLEPWLDLFKYEFDSMPFYIGFDMGMTYNTMSFFRDGKVWPIDLDEPASENCFPPLTIFEITNPLPFGGYDCRCRPWYQLSKNSNNLDQVEM